MYGSEVDWTRSAGWFVGYVIIIIIIILFSFLFSTNYTQEPGREFDRSIVVLLLHVQLADQHLRRAFIFGSRVLFLFPYLPTTCLPSKAAAAVAAAAFAASHTNAGQSCAIHSYHFPLILSPPYHPYHRNWMAFVCILFTASFDSFAIL